MLPGYNHNIHYRDEVFHVQTEDSGVENPHVITHVFVGGNIVETRKTSYADIVNHENLTTLLKDLMQDQHKAMLKSLITGTLDHRIAERSVNAAKLNGPAPLNVEAGAQERASFLMPGAGAPSGPTGTDMPRKPAAAASSPAGAVPPPLPTRPAKAPSARPAPVAGPPPPSQVLADGLTADIIEADILAKAFASKKEILSESLFGEDLISEKSLDEVILSYLVEDIQRD